MQSYREVEGGLLRCPVELIERQRRESSFYPGLESSRRGSGDGSSRRVTAS